MSFPPPEHSPQSAVSRNQSLTIPQLLSFAAAAAVIIGALLDWAVIQTILGSISATGMEGDGKLTAILAAIAGALLLRKSAGATLGAAITFAIVVAIAAYDYGNVQSAIDNVNTTVAKASVGVGLYLTLIGGIGGVIASLVRRGELAAARTQQQSDN